MYLVQTVSSQPRTWSSYTNVSVREAQAPQKMNSAEEISKYHDNNGHYCSPVLARRAAGTNYDFPEKSPKKDKKWSLGSLFRRKKKPGSESSSEEENEARHFLQKKKKKADKRKRVNKVTGFDHVVVSPSSRHTAFPNGYKASDDPAAVLSEPNVTRPVSKNFIPASDFTTTLVPLKDGQENLERSGLDRSNNSLGSPSVNSLGRRRKEFVKARAAARRDTSKGDDSSDEDSQRSAFRSDESLTKHRDSSLSRKSRAARTQRYLKRRSKDEEPQDQLRVCKSDVEHDCPRNFQYLKLPDERLQNIKSASKSPILSATPKSKLCYTNSAPSTRPNFSGLSTIPPAHSSLNKYRAINFANGSMQKHSSFFDYNSAGNKNAPADLNNQRSLSCGANIYNSAPSPSPSPEVVHVQFSLGKPFQNRRPNSIVAHQINLGRRQPPPPPPRDPRRIINFQNHDGRPISYSFENGSQSNAASDQQLNKIQVAESNHARNLNSARRSTSEDHISWDASQRVPLVPRPSSATPEMSRLQKLGKTENSNGYRYLADKNPRSRKPICIQSCKSAEKPSSSPIDQPNQFSKPFDFWKQKDEEINQINGKQSVPNSPLMFTAQTRVRTNIFLPNGVKVETNPQETRREVSPFRPITPPKPLSPDKIETSTSSVDDTDTMRRKSSNLEDALDELEAIYNSLHLGDEDLLERAEQRETEAAQKRRDAAFESFPNSVSRGALSDSSFGYDFNFDTRRKRRLRKPEPDLKTDDMAFRKLNRDRYNTISDPQAVVSKVSYLLTSPVFNAPTDESSSQKVASKNKEPDVTFDDVVYRNVKHTNNTLKVIDPQPPFGIPVGPILPASNSDYLHAAPETTQRFTFKPKRVPDVVKDDLAYRNLRKDPNKEPALPPFNLNPDDYLNNNGDTFKKKRAVRSLSANIFNLTHKDGKLTGNNISLGDDSEFKEQNIGDVADALEIARQILKEKDNNITATRKAFMSDGELKHNKYEGLSPNEQRVNFLKELKTNCFNNDNVYHHKLQVNIPKIDYDRLNSKPPTPDRSRKGSRTSKESTPIPLSPSEETHIKKQQQSVIDDLLASLAAEANETNERIDDELKRYEGEIERKPLFENCFKDRLLEEQKEEKREKLKELEKDAIAASFNLQVSDANGDSNSEHAKLCEKLLECVIESADLMTATKQEPEPSEEVAKIADEPPLPKTVANIVLTPNDVNPISTEIFSESEHDYANIQSPEETEVETTTKDGFKENDDEEEFRIAASLTDDDEEKALLIDDDIVSLDICTSPLDRRKTNQIKEDEMIRDIRMSRYNESEGESSRVIEQTDKGGGKQRRFRRQRSRSCQQPKMSEIQGTRAERVARYKEERRKQLASQFAPFNEPQTSPKRRPVHKDTSSSSEEPRTTRASRLRAAASAQDSSSSSKIDKEKSPVLLSSGSDAQRNRLERDKSNKRKSNLNRALNSEEVPEAADDALSRRRRRRFFPPEVLQQATKDPSPNDENSKSDSLTASSIISSTAAPTARTTPKKSELSIHMENARKGHLVSYSEMGKYSRASPKKAKEKSPKPSSTPEIDSSYSFSDSSNGVKLGNKENLKGSTKYSVRQEKNGPPSLSSDYSLAKQHRSSSVSKRMDELTALTRETLARVERLTNKGRDSPKHEVDLIKKFTAYSSIKPRQPSTDNSRLDAKPETKADTRVPPICDSGKTQTHSILKKKSIEEPFVEKVPTVIRSPPVSILKRKVSQDEFRSQGPASSTSTPPVTFSPSVVDPSTNRKKQGILKKRRSLDEAQVLRHRSCSPEGGLNGKPDSRSILKNQRRSSLEEIVRARSPEPGLHSILKRRTSRHEDEVDPPINSPEPHGILKRRSGSSSAGTNVNSPHVSIATAVILAAAGGAEIILEPNEPVKPILKKKSFSDDQPLGDGSISEVPKPILKKKSSTDTEDCEEKPMKPILKNTKSSLDERESESLEPLHYNSSFKYGYQKKGDDSSECEVRPILKQTTSRENSPRPRLSFYAEEGFSSSSVQCTGGIARYQKVSRRSHTICTDFNLNDVCVADKTKNETVENTKPISVCDMVLNIEKRLSTGAIPKKTNPKRHSERYRTQPVTYHELEASLSSVYKPFQQDLSPPSYPLSSPILSSDNNGQNAHSLLDLTSFDGENTLSSSLLSCSLPNTTLDSGICGKMSSDSAFQSLGDGLELDQEEKLPSPSATKALPDKIEPARLQMKALAEEAKNLQLKRGGAGGFKFKSRKGGDGPNCSRFATQPITLDEVKEASRLKKDLDTDVDAGFITDESDPSRLSLSERIKIFNNISAEKLHKPKPRFTRFQTQPITLEEVKSARSPAYNKRGAFALDEGRDELASPKERKGILKSKTTASQASAAAPKLFDSLKSVLKKPDSPRPRGSSPGNLRSILKPETIDFARDEGISSDESSGTGSDGENGAKSLSAPSGSDKDGKPECVPISVRLAKICSEKVRTQKITDKYRSDSKSSGEDTTQTSDGDSSGGREVRSIIANSFSAKKRLHERLNNEGLILKSKSQGAVRDEDEIQGGGVRRSLTQATMPKTIAELQAKLQKSGDNEWRKRIPKLNNANEELSLLNVKNIYNEELTEKTSILAARKDELDAASKQWRNRVEQTDAVNFSVAGRMQQSNDIPTTPINLPTPNKAKRTPKAKAFKGKEGGDISIETTSTPTSPEKAAVLGFKRSISLPGAGDDSSTGSDESQKPSGRKVRVERPDNITFTSFFNSIDSKRKSDVLDVSVDDFDIIVRQPGELLVQKRTVKVQRKHEASRNPIKALAARTDIKDEYTEVITGVAEKEKHRLNIEKLAKSSNFAVEALAGLASKEDFSAVALKRSSSLNSSFPPFSDLMLLQVKGRRYVQTRLVEPVAASINEGDNYILVTPNLLFNYIGAYANVIEQSRAADIVNSIQQSGDLGCKPDRLVTINSKKLGSCSMLDLEKFWKLLGSQKGVEVALAGHPDEDEVYESSILGTNMIYEYKNEVLVPLDEYWGTIPKIEMLNLLKIIVFDFGSEMYIWSGKNALLEDKKKALKLARELWSEGYNYTECNINPIGVASLLGSRKNNVPVLKDSSRPKWALFAKITQHRETVLFKEKFLDWPDYSRVIRVKESDSEKSVEAKFNFKPCDVDQMLQRKAAEPDLEVDGLHLGRGVTYFDEESKRLFNFSMRSVTCWVILEYSHEQLTDSSVGQFHEGNSYIVRWEYCANITGRELSGKPSKHMQAGRDHCVYFCWQGSNATVNEKGAAALLTIKLDSENARQIRVIQGLEPPVFLALFKGSMVVHSEKREKPNINSCKLYICRGEVPSEIFLSEVACSMRSLRSRACFILVKCKSGEVIIWNGSKATSHCKEMARQAADKIIEEQPSEFSFSDSCDEISLEAVVEGAENGGFLSALGGEKRQLYLSLSKSPQTFDYTPRLFHLSSISGSFEAIEVLCPYRSEHVTPYPFLQSELYSANQPALFMLDNGHEVWLWQGWWPEREDDVTLVDQTGSGAIRWQEERKVAMQTTVNYFKQNSNGEKPVSAYLVWAGLEPLAFTNLFPLWRDQDDITELNIQEGRKAGEAIAIEKELALLTRSTYPLEQLLQRPLPDGVDPTHLENYLSPEDFSTLMSMTLEEFQKLPAWKQTSVKKEKGLF